MLDWLKQLTSLLAQENSISLVTVIRVGGSVPREVGARMLVGRHLEAGTIGGGNLEYQSIAIARDILLSGQTATVSRTFALGPALGQCCGGQVELLFEPVFRDQSWLASLQGESGRSGWWCRPLESAGGRLPGIYCADQCGSNPLRKRDPAIAGAQLLEIDNTRWFCEPLYADNPEVWLFGAGHVGQAVVAQLALLRCDVVWIDQRAGLLQAPLAAAPRFSLTMRECLVPAEEVADAPAQVHYVVMTHSHAIDYDVCRAVLERRDFRYLGLIGSVTKGNQFSRRLRHRGVPDSVIKRMHCPLGFGSIRSRRPESIALSLAAQLAVLWEHTGID